MSCELYDKAYSQIIGGFYKIWEWVLWGIAAMILLAPKSSEIYAMLFVIWIITWLVIPVVLNLVVVEHLHNLYHKKEKEG